MTGYSVIMGPQGRNEYAAGGRDVAQEGFLRHLRCPDRPRPPRRRGQRSQGVETARLLEAPRPENTARPRPARDCRSQCQGFQSKAGPARRRRMKLSGGRGATAGAYDNATNRDLMIAAVNDNRMLAIELSAKLDAADAAKVRDSAGEAGG